MLSSGRGQDRRPETDGGLTSLTPTLHNKTTRQQESAGIEKQFLRGDEREGEVVETKLPSCSHYAGTHPQGPQLEMQLHTPGDKGAHWAHVDSCACVPKSGSTVSTGQHAPCHLHRPLLCRLALVKPGKPRVLREKWTKETLGGLLTGVP